MLTVSEVASKYGVTNRQVLYAIERGLLPAIKVGWIWIIIESTLPDKFPLRSYQKEKYRQ